VALGVLVGDWVASPMEAAVTAPRLNVADAVLPLEPVAAILWLPDAPAGTWNVDDPLPGVEAVSDDLIATVVVGFLYQTTLIFSPPANPDSFTVTMSPVRPAAGERVRLDVTLNVSVVCLPLVPPRLMTLCVPLVAAGILNVLLPLPVFEATK